MNRIKTSDSTFYDTLAKTRRQSRGFSCGYDQRYNPKNMAENSLLISRLGSVMDRAGFSCQSGRVLDAGCGTFFTQDLLGKRFDRCVGVDHSFFMLKESSKTNPAVCGDLAGLPFGDACFDAVFSLDMLHHVDDPKTTMEEIFRVIKPGGRYLAIEPNMCNPGMFAAHLLPPEERKAVLLNYPFILSRLFYGTFGKPNCFFVNLGISAGFSKLANRLFPFDEQKGTFWSLRMVFVSRKPQTNHLAQGTNPDPCL